MVALLHQTRVYPCFGPGRRFSNINDINNESGAGPPILDFIISPNKTEEFTQVQRMPRYTLENRLFNGETQEQSFNTKMFSTFCLSSSISYKPTATQERLSCDYIQRHDHLQLDVAWRNRTWNHLSCKASDTRAKALPLVAARRRHMTHICSAVSLRYMAVILINICPSITAWTAFND